MKNQAMPIVDNLTEKVSKTVNKKYSLMANKVSRHGPTWSRIAALT